MSNALFGYPNRVDSGVVSGGAWQSAAPATNVQDRQLANTARSVDLASASTKLAVDLGISRTLRIMGVVNHNFSLLASYRFRIAQVADFATTTYDTGWIPVWPAVYGVGEPEWEDYNWWSLQYTADQVAGVIWTLVKPFAANVLGRYLLLEVSDPLNADGFIELGRLFVSPAWQPGYNMSYSHTLGHETLTQVDEALSGAEFFDRRDPYRVVQVAFDNLTAADGLANAFELTRRAGIDGEILFVLDPADTVHAIRRQFLARLRSLSPLETPHYNVTKKAFELKELLP